MSENKHMSETQLVKRCGWSVSSQQYLEYHDKEWGVPIHDEHKLFEMLILEGVQAGLSWSLILKKRAGYLRAFDGFDANAIARYDDTKIQQLLTNPEIVRNKLKVKAAILNARAFLALQSQHGGFDAFLWQFVDGQPIQSARQTLQDIPASTRESDAMSKELKHHGFKFVGTTICYAFMQAVGMVNDHTIECFRWRELQRSA